MRPLPASARLAPLVALCALAGCAAPDTTRLARGEIDDPFEGFNREIFAFNEWVDRNILGPSADAYVAVVPEPGRNGARNVIRTLRTPLIFANQTLQGDAEGAGIAAARLALNLTVGLFGLIDVGEEVGLDYEFEDFGQTLSVWGIPEGPYVVAPFFGSFSTTHLVGFGIEQVADPTARYANGNELEYLPPGRTALNAVDQRARADRAIDDLRSNSLDYYAASRAIYAQSRAAQLEDRSSVAPSQSFTDFEDPDDFE